MYICIKNIITNTNMQKNKNDLKVNEYYKYYKSIFYIKSEYSEEINELPKLVLYR